MLSKSQGQLEFYSGTHTLDLKNFYSVNVQRQLQHLYFRSCNQTFASFHPECQKWVFNGELSVLLVQWMDESYKWFFSCDIKAFQEVDCQKYLWHFIYLHEQCLRVHKASALHQWNPPKSISSHKFDFCLPSKNYKGDNYKENRILPLESWLSPVNFSCKVVFWYLKEQEDWTSLRSRRYCIIYLALTW